MYHVYPLPTHVPILAKLEFVLKLLASRWHEVIKSLKVGNFSESHLKTYSPQMFAAKTCSIYIITVQLDNKERFDKEQIGIKGTNLPFTS